MKTKCWFRLYRFRSPLLTVSILFLFLWLLRCFTSPGTPRAPHAIFNFSPFGRSLRQFSIFKIIDSVSIIGNCKLVIDNCVRSTLTVVHTAGFPHSDISGSKPARRLTEAFRSHATSFIAYLCQGILRAPL